MKYINICGCYKNVSIVILNPPSQRKIQQSNAPHHVAYVNLLRLWQLRWSLDRSSPLRDFCHWPFCNPVLGALLSLCAKMEAVFFLEAVLRPTNESNRQFCCCCWCDFDYNLNRNTFHSYVIYFEESASVSSYGWYDNIRHPDCNIFCCREKSI